jgi:hypothetical protein
MSRSTIREAYEIGFDSELSLPELPCSERPADVSVRFGQVPDELVDRTGEGPIFQARPGELLLDALVGRFLVREGREVVIQRKGEATDHDLRIVLLRPVMGALFHQRGLFALHGSAVATPKGAVMFCGHSGYGKSTLAGAMHRRGYDVIADDQSVIRFDRAGAKILPTYPSLYLLPDSMDVLDHRQDPDTKIRKNVEKYQVSVSGGYRHEAMPLHRVYLLAPGSNHDFGLEPVARRDAFRAMLEMVYRIQFARAMGCEAACFHGLGQLSAQVDVVRARRPLVPFQLDRFADLIEDDFS